MVPRTLARNPIRMLLPWKGILLLAALVLLSCDKDKPSTPFQVATALPQEPTAPFAPTQVSSPDAERSRSAQMAPKNTIVWEVFGRTLRAPAGTQIDGAVPDWAHGSEDLFVLLTPTLKGGRPEEAGLVRVDDAGHPTARILPHPSFLPTGEDCQLSSSLEKSGPQSLTVELHAFCQSRLLPGTPTGSLVVVSPQSPQPVLLELRTLAPSPGEVLSLNVDSSDRDQDGLDDVELRAHLRAPEGGDATLPFVWLTRTAGVSRDTSQPAKALDERASKLARRAVRKAERAVVWREVRALRRLLTAACAELATPRLTHANGDALKCGELGPTLARLTFSAVQAELGAGELGSALGIAERAGWIGRQPTEKENDALRRLLLQKIPHEKAQQLARFDVQAASLDRAYASPLRFSPDGLWLLDPGGKIKRLTMKGDPPLASPTSQGPSHPRIEPPPRWTLAVADSSGKQLSTALPSCERSEVQLAFTVPKGPPPGPVPIPMLAPRPGNCRTFTGVELGAEPIEWVGGQLLLHLGGELATSGGHVRVPPGPLAHRTTFGLAVRDGSRLTLWTDVATTGLHHCVASRGAATTSESEANVKVACLKGGSVYVYAPAPKNDTLGTKGRAE